MRRSMILACSCILLTASIHAQNCQHSTDLFCQIPVATRAAFPGTQGNPAAAFNSSFATQLALLPLVSSASEAVPVYVKAIDGYIISDNLGPIFTERARSVGKHKLFLAFTYQRFRFNSIDGTDLNNVPFVFVAQPTGSKTSSIYVQQSDRIDMNLDQFAAVATYGLDQNTDVSVVVPFERVSVGVSTSGKQYINFGSSVSTVPFSQYVPGSARGIGDVLVNAKRLLWKRERSTVGAGIALRFPTGDALNYLGSGAYGFQPYGLFSYQARVSPHFKIGYQFNTATVLNPSFGSNEPQGLPGGLQYVAGADANIYKKRVTAVVDLLGDYVLNAPVLVRRDKVIPIIHRNEPTLAPAISSYTMDQLSIGAKIKPTKNLFVYANVLFPLNNVGLRANPVPLAGISYKF